MKSGIQKGARLAAAAAVPILSLAGEVWGGPPLPPGYSSTPSVPVGGNAVVAAATVAIAAYGIWKSRR